MRRMSLASLMLLVAPVLSGCGSIYSTVAVNAAQARLEQARVAGAEQAAPYEYTFAREHLRKARLEAAEASYSDAAAYADTAELYAQKAIDLVESAKKSEGK
jgi:hypothetical protein